MNPSAPRIAIACLACLSAACSSSSSSQHPANTGDGGSQSVGWNSVVGGAGLFAQSFDDTPWEVRASGTQAPLFSVSCASGTEGWVAGAGGLVSHTQDGGRSWATQQSGVDADLYAIRFGSLADGVVAGAGGALAATHDGGATWTTHSLPTTSSLRGAAYVGGPSVVVVVGDGGVVLRSTDGASTWTSRTLDATANLRAAASDAAGHALYAVDDRGQVWSSADAGATFALETTTTTPLAAVDVSNDGTFALAVGAEGAAFVRRNAQTWAPASVPSSVDLHAALVTGNDSLLYVAGDLGTLFASKDGGGSWILEALGTTAPLYGLDDF
jgi:photosystem II stability/assembly factor-like uncharacterized protein